MIIRWYSRDLRIRIDVVGEIDGEAVTSHVYAGAVGSDNVDVGSESFQWWIDDAPADSGT